jgi:hypothetical protein
MAKGGIYTKSYEDQFAGREQLQGVREPEQ